MPRDEDVVESAPVGVTKSEEISEAEGSARLVPVSPELKDDVLAAWWDEVDRLADEISASWRTGVSAVQSVTEGRREL